MMLNRKIKIKTASSVHMAGSTTITIAITNVYSVHMAGSNGGVSDFKSSFATPTMMRSLSGSWQG